MPKTIAGHAASAAHATVRSAGAAVKGIHSELPLPQAPQWAGYWNFVSAAIILMFVLYLAQKGRLSVWAQFFLWQTPKQVATASGGTVTPVASAATNAVNSAINSTGLGSAISTGVGVLSNPGAALGAALTGSPLPQTAPIAVGTTPTNAFGGTSLYGYLQKAFPSLFGGGSSGNSAPTNATPSPGANPGGNSDTSGTLDLGTFNITPSMGSHD